MDKEEIAREEASEEIGKIEDLCGDVFSEVQYYGNPPPKQWAVNKLTYIRRELEKLLETLRK